MNLGGPGVPAVGDKLGDGGITAFVHLYAEVFQRSPEYFEREGDFRSCDFLIRPHFVLVPEVRTRRISRACGPTNSGGKALPMSDATRSLLVFAGNQ